MHKQAKLWLEKAQIVLQKYLTGLEPMTPSFELHSSATELLNLSLENTAELWYN
jgi:hypothetical protein